MTAGLLATDAKQRPTGLLAVLFAFETSMYAVLSPMLPHFERVLGASKAALGLLVGVSSAGTIVGSVLSVWAVSLFGVRRTTALGVVALVFGLGAFGFVRDIAVLDFFRALQGFSSGLIWGGGLTWVLAGTPAGQRGAVVGWAWGTAIAGTFAGPVIGTLAVTVGTGIVFLALGLIAAILAVLVLSYPEPAIPPSTGFSGSTRLGRDPAVVLSVWILVLGAIAVGVIITLVPLRLAHLGASTVGIGATFLVGAAANTAVSFYAGRASDRRGSVGLITVSLVIAGITVVILPLPTSALVLAALTVLIRAGPMTGFLLPASTLLIVAVEQTGVALVVATMLMMLCFAVGEAIGAPAGATLAQVAGEAVPFACLAGLLLGTAALVLHRRHQPQIEAALAARQQPPSESRESAQHVPPTHKPTVTPLSDVRQPSETSAQLNLNPSDW
jgi:predicted MFS family arabinose efflux permease